MTQLRDEGRKRERTNMKWLHVPAPVFCVVPRSIRWWYPHWLRAKAFLLKIESTGFNPNSSSNVLLDKTQTIFYQLSEYPVKLTSKISYLCPAFQVLSWTELDFLVVYFTSVSMRLCQSQESQRIFLLLSKWCLAISLLLDQLITSYQKILPWRREENKINKKKILSWVVIFHWHCYLSSSSFVFCFVLFWDRY